MISSRCSKVTTLALLLALVFAAAAPAAAVSVADEDVPEDAEVGTTVEATYTLDSLYQEPSFTRWTLRGSTELTNVTWVVLYRSPSGSTVAQKQYSGQSFSQQGVDAESDTGPFDSPITEIEVTVRGTVPPVSEYDYDEPASFLVSELTQRAGDTGSTNTIGTWEAHHYTTADEDGNPGSREARRAIANAEQAIANAEQAGADTTAANRTLDNAIEFYDSGDFSNAVKNARSARQTAVEAEEAAESSQQTTQLLMYGGLAVLVLALLGGGYWYYQQQQDDYDKLG